MKTITKMKKVLGSLTVAAFALTASVAHADGLAIHASSLPANVRTSLEKDISAARLAHPEAFEAVKGVKGYHKQTYQKYRNPKPHVVAELRALGPNALLPMLDELAFNAPARGDSTDDEMSALTVGLVEAVGSLRDSRSGPVLRAIFEAQNQSGIAAASARALGKLGGDADLAELQKHDAATDAQSSAAIEGLGECRRIEAANELATLLAGTTDETRAGLIAKAFGNLGSSWAWKTLGSVAEQTGLAVREVAAKALVPEFVKRTGVARSRVGKAILMLDHPSLPALIASARTNADSDTQRDLDAIADVVKKHLAP